MTTDQTPAPNKPLEIRFLALALILIGPLMMIGCPSRTNKPTEGPAPPSASSAPAKSAFDGDRAFEQVRKQVEFGPRPAGSAELEKTRGYMISSHYDTKYFKDIKFVGANDGGSSTGALMEIARVMAANKQKPKMTYWFVFFDGEEAFCFDWDECHNPNPADPKNPLPDHTYGSRRYVAQLTEKNELKRVRAMILLDMMGYKNLRLGRADLGTAWLTDIVWQTAKQLGYGNVFIDSLEGVGDDDHGPFLKAGVEAIDIIQLSTYEYWHTKDDTLDKISGKSLKIVGDTVIASLPKIEERLSRSSK